MLYSLIDSELFVFVMTAHIVTLAFELESLADWSIYNNNKRLSAIGVKTGSAYILIQLLYSYQTFKFYFTPKWWFRSKFSSAYERTPLVSLTGARSVNTFPVLIEHCAGRIPVLKFDGKVDENSYSEFSSNLKINKQYIRNTLKKNTVITWLMSVDQNDPYIFLLTAIYPSVALILDKIDVPVQ